VDPDIDFLFIENVGNLVCPASYELGEHLRCVLLSTPEGDDKPKKYPKAFTTSDLLVLTKADLLPHLPFDVEKAKTGALELNPKLKIFVTSAVTGQGLDELLEYFWAVRQELQGRHA